MKITTYIILFCCFIIAPTFVYSQKISDDAYDFPIRPGMPEWKELKTYTEILEAIQIPDDIVKDMSTLGLVETILNYPDLINILSHPTYQEGFQLIVGRFNGYQELISRPDAGNKLLDIYSRFDPNKNEPMVQYQDHPIVFEYLNIELLLAQPEIINTLDYREKIKLSTIIINKYNEKIINKSKFGNLSIISSCLVISRLITSFKDPEMESLITHNSELQEFAVSGAISQMNQLDDMVKKFEALLIKNHK